MKSNTQNQPILPKGYTKQGGLQGCIYEINGAARFEMYHNSKGLIMIELWIPGMRRAKVKKKHKGQAYPFVIEMYEKFLEHKTPEKKHELIYIGTSAKADVDYCEKRQCFIYDNQTAIDVALNGTTEHINKSIIDQYLIDIDGREMDLTIFTDSKRDMEFLGYQLIEARNLQAVMSAVSAAIDITKSISKDNLFPKGYEQKIKTISKTLDKIIGKYASALDLGFRKLGPDVFLSKKEDEEKKFKPGGVSFYKNKPSMDGVFDESLFIDSDDDCNRFVKVGISDGLAEQIADNIREELFNKEGPMPGVEKVEDECEDEINPKNIIVTENENVIINHSPWSSVHFVDKPPYYPFDYDAPKE